MKILFFSVPFRPSLGGIETVSALLAHRFHDLGHQVVLMTQSSALGPDHEPYTIVRQPTGRVIRQCARWADVIFHNNISLRFAWQHALIRKPWVVAHHTWIPRSGPGALAGLCKRLAVRLARNIAVSRAVADSLPVRCTVVPNPYDDDLFVACNSADDSRSGLVFLGRLVSDKGVAVLLSALELLKLRGITPSLTIIGSGDEEPALRDRCTRGGIDRQVTFAGPLVGRALVDRLNAHAIMVVPSVWEEPFGVVALEGIACGCVPVVAASGGLSDAVGDCGVVVAKGDAAALAGAIERLIANPKGLVEYRAAAAQHLARHTRDRVSAEYLRVIEDEYQSSHA